MRPKPPLFNFFSPIPHRPLHMGIELWVWGKSLGSLDGLEDEEVRWEERRVHLECEKLTVAMILGGGVGG
ncbi:unnamed protein product [Prunus armeniaca]